VVAYASNLEQFENTSKSLALIPIGLVFVNPANPSDQPFAPDNHADNEKTEPAPHAKGDSLSLWQRPGIRRLIKGMILGIVLLFLSITIYRVYEEFRDHEKLISELRIRFFYLFASVLLTVAALVPGAIVWLGVLRAFGQKFPFLPALDAYYLGHAGKYVPGKAMVLVLRVGKLQPYGVSIKPAIVSVFVETLTGVSTAAILG